MRHRFEEREQRRRDLADALLARLRGVEPKGPAAIYADCTIRDFERLANLDMPSPDVRMAGTTTGDYPNILGDVFTKRLLDFYRDRRPAYRTLARPVRLVDFKVTTLLRVGEFPQLLQVGPAGEVKSGYLGDGGEPLLLLSFARIFGLSFMAVINDDVLAFNQVAELGADAAVFAENALFFASLLMASGAGPTMSDGVALFHANHGNLMTGAALDSTSLGLSMAAMRKQLAPGGAKINLPPRHLLVGPDNEVRALKAVAEISAAGQALLDVVVDAHLGAAWYVFAAPQDRAAFVRGFLGSDTGPASVARTGFVIDGPEWRVSTHVAIGAADWRAVVRNPGV